MGSLRQLLPLLGLLFLPPAGAVLPIEPSPAALAALSLPADFRLRSAEEMPEPLRKEFFAWFGRCDQFALSDNFVERTQPLVSAFASAAADAWEAQERLAQALASFYAEPEARQAYLAAFRAAQEEALQADFAVQLWNPGGEAAANFELAELSPFWAACASAESPLGDDPAFQCAGMQLYADSQKRALSLLGDALLSASLQRPSQLPSLLPAPSLQCPPANFRRRCAELQSLFREAEAQWERYARLSSGRLLPCHLRAEQGLAESLLCPELLEASNTALLYRHHEAFWTRLLRRGASLMR